MAKPMNAAEFARRWGRGLKKATAKSLAGSGLPDSTVTFLCEAGLPTKGPLLLSFDLARGAPALDDYLRELGKAAPKSLHRYRRIGTDEGSEVCLDLESAASVVSVVPGSRTAKRFVNTSVAQLGGCMVAYVAYAAAVKKKATETQQMKLVEKLVAEIGAIDPQAVARKSNWWALVLEQARLGQL